MSISDKSDLLKFLELFPDSSREIALELRDFIWKRYPDCNELIYDNYNFLAVGWAPTDRMGDIFCSIAVGTRGVFLGFNWGVKLDDPEGLLSGGGNQFRSIAVTELKTFPKTYAEGLMSQAFEYAISRLKGRTQTPSGQTIVKSISPTKRRPGMAKAAPAAKRERHPMPDLVLNALKKNKLVRAYEARPPYQQNDYIGWIMSAKRDETRVSRLEQMLDELRGGDRYMKMSYKPAKVKK